MRQPPWFLEQYKNRILGVFFALVFAILWMTIGFWETVAVSIIVTIGYLIGAYYDGELDAESWFRFFDD